MVRIVLNIAGEDNNNSIGSDNDKTGFVPYSKVRAEIWNLRDGDDVLIKGGEPLIHPEFFKILSDICNKSLREITILTNARIFSYDKFCSKFKNYKDISFLVEVLGHNSKLHDSLSRVNGSFKQTLGGIKNLIRLNFKVNTLVPLLKDNYKHLNEVVNMLKNLGVDNIVLYNPAPRSNCLANYNDIIPKFSIVKGSLMKVLRENKFFVQFENFPYCFFRGYHGNISDLLNYNNDLKVKVPKCDKCSYNGVCSGIFARYIEQHGSVEISPMRDVKVDVQDALKGVLKKSLINISLDEMYILLRKIKEKPNFWDAIYDLGYPIPLAVLMLDEMRKNGLVDVKGSNVRVKIKLKELNNKILAVSKSRLPSNPNLCQLTVSQHSIEKRIEFIARVCGSGGKIAILGDDDFISISLASKGIFDEIVVFEFDDRIIERIKNLAKKNKFNISVIKQDLRKRMPGEYCGKFDAFYTDPPYSPAGVSLFVSRGVELLKKRMKCHGFVSFSCEMPVIQEIELAVQDSLTKMGLFIERKDYGGLNDVPKYIRDNYDDFFKLRNVLFENKQKINKLDEWFLAALCRKEFMFHLWTTHYTKPSIVGDFNEEIYYKDKPLSYYTNKEFINKMKAEKAYLDF